MIRLLSKPQLTSSVAFFQLIVYIALWALDFAARTTMRLSFLAGNIDHGAITVTMGGYTSRAVQPTQARTLERVERSLRVMS